MRAKQKMAGSLRSLMSSVLGIKGTTTTTTTTATQLFPATDAATDGDECLHDCASCTIRFPSGFKIDTEDELYGHVKGWGTHLIVGTGKTDWVRDVTDEVGSVMEAVGRAEAPENGRLMLSASNLPTGHDDGRGYASPTTVLLLPALVLVRNVQPSNVPTLLETIVSTAPTTASCLEPWTPLPSAPDAEPPLLTARCPHAAVILLCSQRTRDARCGQSAPLLRRELERHLRPLGLTRDLDDERPGGVAIYFISHVGGHKYSANVMVYRRPDAFGLDDDDDGDTDGWKGNEEGQEKGDVGAAQCIWLARIRPEDCENLVKFTVLKGKVVKPGSQLRGGFDRAKGLTSW